MRERLAKVEAGWQASLAAFDAARDRMLLEARQDVLRLAVLIGEMVTKRALAIEPGRVADQLEAVLATLAKPSRLTIAVNPDDQDLVRQALPGLSEKYAAAVHVEITTDASLARGSCVARTGGGGIIDASIATQLERIVETLMPAPETVAPGAERSDEP
jgi:flagellar biosynthesis/type III secretory pathway protein FliH